jgi:hypothetical protein
VNLDILRDHAGAVCAVRRRLLLDRCPVGECRFEILRATIWSIANPSNHAHINRVLAAALPTWRLLAERPAASDETLRTELRDALSALQDAGDLVSLGGGYWAPGTTRLVEFPERDGTLIVGGVPSGLLKLDSEAIGFHGPHRHLLLLPEELAAVLPREDFDSWAKRPEPGTLQQWAREVFDSLERVAYTPGSPEVLEFYQPGIARIGVPQYFRWSGSPPRITGTLLARRRRVYGAYDYRLVDIAGGHVVGVCELHDIDVRRLMYALDLDTSNPVQARSRRVDSQTEWLFRSPLPRAEQRAFAAIGTLAISDERRYESRWTFSRHEELAIKMMRSLGIGIE